MVLYGHTPVPEPEWLNNTVCLDTGCVFGGRLTAFNYPERTVVSVPAARVHYAPARPLPSGFPLRFVGPFGLPRPFGLPWLHHLRSPADDPRHKPSADLATTPELTRS